MRSRRAPHVLARATGAMLFPLGALVLLLALSACEHTEAPAIDDPDLRCPGQESPEAVLNTLIVSYRRREIETYARLLHPEFIFRFQDGDEPADLGRSFWTRDEDSTGTAALFNSEEVLDITIDLTYHDAEPATEVGFDEGTMKIRVSPMKITVDDVSGTTYLVEGDIEDFYFVRGAGADSLCWYIIEWRDIDGGGGIGAPDGGILAGATERGSWGRLKQQY